MIRPPPESVAWLESAVLWRLRAHALASMGEGGGLSEAELDEAIQLVIQIDRELERRGEVKDIEEDDE
jgi:predicted NUDIX family phosphoesterase